MKVSEIPYERYTVEQAKQAAQGIIERIKNARTAEEIKAARDDFNALSEQIETASSLANCRFTLNTRDEFYNAEMDYYDSAAPLFAKIQNEYERAMLSSPLRAEAEKLINPRVFKAFEISQKTFSDDVIEDLQAENALVTEYSKFMGELAFEFDGEKMPLSVLRGKLEDDDREVRRRAAEAIGKTLGENSDTLDSIFDRLVKIRTTVARKLGFDNFVELGYCRMGRVDYDSAMVAEFRRSVEQDIVPAVVRYTGELARAAREVELLGVDASVQKELLTRVNVLLRQAGDALADLRVKQEKAAALTGAEQARYAHDVICPAMEVLRAPVDHLEMIVDGRLWPMPTYGDLLFNV